MAFKTLVAEEWPDVKIVADFLWQGSMTAITTSVKTGCNTRNTNQEENPFAHHNRQAYH
jgi:hypothetical protein